MLRGTALGCVLGVLPGGGAALSSFAATDLVTGNRWTWDDAPYVRLGPGYGEEPVHIIHVTRD